MSSDRPRVLVVDDSALLRRVVREMLESDGFRVVGESGDGWDAIRRVHALDPDLVTLDIDMPGLGGLETLGYVMSERPRPVLMLSAHDAQDGADLTIRALELGAVDFVRKPSWGEALDEATLAARLLPAARAALEGNLAPLVRPLAAPRPWRRPAAEPAPPAGGDPTRAARVLMVGASTGGPRLLTDLVPRLPVRPDLATIIVQHLPAGFTGGLARRLALLSPCPVEEARHGTPVLGGRVYVAPGGRTLRVVPDTGDGLVLSLDDLPHPDGIRPSVDAALLSLAASIGERAMALILTGMGRDGTEGCAVLRRAGATVLVQDPRSCVVAGMPASVLAAGGADLVVLPEDLPARIASVLDAPPAL